MPPTPNLDRLLELAGVLGADAAWLLHGSEVAELNYVGVAEGEATITIHNRGQSDGAPIVLVARFPYDDLADWGLTELKLPPGRDREIQAAALVAAAIDALSQIGPQTTLRVLKWVFARYGIEGHPWTARDRRPKSAPAAPTPILDDATWRALPEGVQVDLLAVERGKQLREQRQALNVSQRTLAERAGTRQTDISRHERGEVAVEAATWAPIEAALVELGKERGA